MGKKEYYLLTDCRYSLYSCPVLTEGEYKNKNCSKNFFITNYGFSTLGVYEKRVLDICDSTFHVEDIGMKKLFIIIVLTLISFPGLAVTAEEKPIGTIKTLTGKAFILRQKGTFPAKIGLKIFQHDIVKTLDDGTLGVILRDDTTFSLGPKSELSMEEFSFVPTEGKFSFFANIA